MPPRRKPTFKRGFMKRAAAATRSGLRRYPTQLARSLRKQADHLHHGVTPDGAGPKACPVWPAMPAAPLAASWLGHATSLVKIGDLTVLTDPVLSGRIGPRVGGRTMGVQRLMACPTGEPPKVDVILISHAHFDHLDRPTLRKLIHPETTVITARHTGRLIPGGFGDVVEMDWDQELTHRGVAFTAIRPEHWGARTAWDRHRGFNAYMMRHGPRSALFAGDTAATDAFKGLKPELAIFGIGAYSPWQHMHATPEEVWDMFMGSGGRWLMPIHHSTFELSDEHVDEPMERLLKAAREMEEKIVARSPGEVWVGLKPDQDA